MRLRVFLLSLALAALLLPLQVPAQEGETETEAFERNKVGFAVGMTGAGRRENGMTLALIYERRVTESFGIGAEAERVFGDLQFWLFMVPFEYHRGRWAIFAGPGIEMQDDGDDEPLIRIGTRYGFELTENWEIEPAFAVDFVDDEVEVVAAFEFVRGF